MIWLGSLDSNNSRIVIVVPDGGTLMIFVDILGMLKGPEFAVWHERKI